MGYQKYYIVDLLYIYNQYNNMKKLFTVITFLLATFTYSQKENIESSTRIFMDKAQFTRINKDWNTIAEFKSGIGEYVNFYPIEVVDLKRVIKLMPFN